MMTDFSALGLTFRLVLSGLMFIAALLLFFTAVYKYFTTRKLMTSSIESVVFVFIIILLSYLTGSDGKGRANYNVSLPWLAVLFISLCVIVYSTVEFVFTLRKSKNSVSPLSIKQALDNLNSGICFTDENGRIVLINYYMASLVLDETGEYPQSLSQLEFLIKDDALYVAKDKRTFKIISNSIKLDENESFTQISAFDVTALSSANEALKAENELLKEANEKTQLMLERLSERIREEETLNLKMQIHNEIGTSLIAITRIMNGIENGDVETQLKLLMNAVGYFSNNRVKDRHSAIEKTVKKAEAMGVKLVINVMPALSSDAEKIIIAAIDESITNCINHAKADKLFVEFEEKNTLITVIITNNGNPPEEDVKEGGGLLSLRRITESAGGIMLVKSSPQFALEIRLPKGEQND